jgi:beta-glucanase (GH16 family)
MMSIALSLAACDSGQSASGPGADFRARGDTSKTASAPETRRGPASAEKTPFGQNGKDYVLTLSEEFDEFNPRLWNDHIWYEKSNPTTNFTVEAGVLKIWPQRDATGQFFNRTIDTDGKFEQRYGFFEMEAKLPRGKGTWPAFWLFAHPGDRRPEIDIMEAYPGGEGWGFVDADGIARPNTYAATIWITEGKQAGQKMYPTGKDLSAGFHKYAVKWEPERQTFYFDGKEIWSRKVSMADSMYVMLDLWFGGASGKPDASTPEGKGNSFEVNYVRAWKFRKNADQGRTSNE